jgi:hypothetical protein
MGLTGVAVRAGVAGDASGSASPKTTFRGVSWQESKEKHTS